MAFLNKNKSLDNIEMILETMSEGLVVQNANGEITQFNSQALNILGLTEDQLLGRTSTDPKWKAIKEDGSDFNGTEHPAMVTLKTGEKIFGTIMGLHLPIGKLRWIKINTCPLPMPDKTIHVLSTFSDVTAIKESQRDSENFFSISPNLICIATTDGHFKRINKTFTNVLGYSEQELLQEKFINFVHPEDIEKTLEEFKNVSQGISNPKFENRYKAKNGEYKTLSWVSQIEPVTGLIFAIARDITLERQTKEEISFILETLRIGIWKFNPVTQELYWDQSMYKIFDIKEENFSGHYQAWESLLTPKAKEKAIKELELALLGIKEFDTSFEVETKNKGRRFIAGRGRVIRNLQGNAIKMYGINYDITDEVKMEKQLESERLKTIQNAKLASLGEMSAGIAHEINNPLTIISSSLFLLQKFKDHPEKFAEKMSNIERSVERITKIVAGLKKFSRSTNDSIYQEKELKGIIEEAIFLIESKAKRHHVEIEMNLASDKKILCDEVEIEQVLINLIGNAIDAISTKNEKWIKVNLSEKNSKLILQIIDSGDGISEAIEDKIFQPFFTTKPVGEGTGLGLSISREILKQHKAIIFINRDFSYTCFELHFPLLTGENL